MNATNAATPADEKCHLKYGHACLKCVCAWGLLGTLCSGPCPARGAGLCWLSPVSNVRLQNWFEMSVMCGSESWQQTASSHLVQSWSLDRSSWPHFPSTGSWSDKPCHCCYGCLVEESVTGFLQKQPSHEPKGWVTALCYLQKDTLDRICAPPFSLISSC